ncbi:alkylation response protein AidB-like acyl-CoA dehydrogenase [Trueperella bonasi]|uniref:Alkylation response protein AidB-like acyl-CoA dehydrogenase n=1 Tax=Trueperella bonasi TaxID=312286 RepID=A0ABT9NEB8_9ACTO|nr:acyl-CoA dehydrogenase family protein [Trueperella bonasi]MDP9805729.1 alkylation response protein AidB-like acyl-CoA dehydrogenase [Trueperella bonasi]
MAFLSEELLGTIASRAAEVDRENSFPHEDFEDLKNAGYFKAFVPEEYGGLGLSSEEICENQMLLAKASPATALGINMHHIIVGLGRHLVDCGVESGKQILEGAANGELYAFGISEPGNDRVLFGSITKAKQESDGGYSFTGLKVFTSLAPVWTKLMVYGHSEEDGGTSVFALLDRDLDKIEIKDDWDVVGMRGTQSHSTMLNGAYARPEQLLQKVAPGPSMEPVVFGIFAWFETFLAATYLGIGLRAIEVAAEYVKKRRSVLNDDVYANDPAIRWRLADAAIRMNSAQAEVTLIARDLDAKVDRGALWYPQLSAAKNAASEASFHAVQEAIRSCGGGSYSNSNELSRLYRDVLAGLFQPSDQESLHAAWANVVLG